MCHDNNVCVVATGSYGLMGYTFVDFGDKFVSVDTDGLEPTSGVAVSISNANPGVVQLEKSTSYNTRTKRDETDGDRHGLVDGDFVRFQKVEGMVELNDEVPRQVKVIDPFTFSIEDTTGYGKYMRGGYFVKVKQPVEFAFKPFTESAKDPELLFDWKHMTRPKNLHNLLTVSELVCLSVSPATDDGTLLLCLCSRPPRARLFGSLRPRTAACQQQATQTRQRRCLTLPRRWHQSQRSPQRQQMGRARRRRRRRHRTHWGRTRRRWRRCLTP